MICPNRYIQCSTLLFSMYSLLEFKYSPVFQHLVPCNLVVNNQPCLPITMSFLSLKLDNVFLQTNPLAVIMGVEQYKAALAMIEDDDDDDDEGMFWAQKNDSSVEIQSRHHSQKKKRRRTKYNRQCITECNWWKMFICPEMTVECESDPDRQQAKLF